MTLPSTLEKADLGFVAYCYKLVEIVNKSNVSSESILENKNWNGMENLKQVSDEQTVVEANGFWFIKAEGEYYMFYYNGDETEVVLPDSDDLDFLNGNKYSITSKAFAENNNITSVVVSSSVKFIDYGAFQLCRQLVSVVFEDGVEEIGDWVFAQCDKLQEIEIPDSVTKMGEYVFNSCFGLRKVILTSSCTYGKQVFSYCMSLNEIYYYGTAEEFNETFGTDSGIDLSMIALYVNVEGSWVRAN